uniref:Malate dehydrogenase n=1 Tax=Acrobeloides nanus TaxID=290746 RepID=A0A914DI66_9BILA
MKRFMTECMVKVGSNPDHAQQLADLLTYADQRGHYSHGVNRLHIYVRDVKVNATTGDGTPKILKQKGCTAWVDGQNLLGVVVGNFCTDLAIKLAKEHGVGWVVANGSNHFGAAGYYSTRCAAEGLVGMSFTNASPTTFPTRAGEKGIGNNPLSFIAEGENGDGFALDMACSTVAYGKVEVERRLGHKTIPNSWGVDSNGHETTDPEAVVNGGGLTPLGGHEATGGYKGSGIAMMVEIICGVLGGAAIGKNIRNWQNTTVIANLGQCFVAVDPECFADGFHHRLQKFIDETRGLKPADPKLPVLVAGDPERAFIKKSQENGGLVYPSTYVGNLNDLANELGIKPCHFDKIH